MGERLLNPPPTARPHDSSRQRAIAYARAHLEQTTHPRLVLSLIVTAAALIGFFTSFALLELGVRTMAWRYGVAAIVGYAAFLAGLRLWLSRQGRQGPELSNGLDVLIDLGPLPIDVLPPEVPLPPFHFGGGGGFSGGGAGGGLGGPVSPGDLAAAADVSPAGDAVAGAAADAASGTDEGLVLLIPILFIATIVVGLVGVVMVLVGAPSLLAELLVDGVIAGVAYRRLKRVPVRHWVHGAVRRTWKPMLALAIMLVATALIAQSLVPAADSIGDFFHFQDDGRPWSP
jgi:hypothetical protein